MRNKTKSQQCIWELASRVKRPKEYLRFKFRLNWFNGNRSKGGKNEDIAFLHF